MFRHLFALLPLVAAGVFPVAHAATLNCNPSSAPPIVHGEGITERTSDIVFACSGGTPNATLTVDLYHIPKRQYHQPPDIRLVKHYYRYFIHGGQWLRTSSHCLARHAHGTRDAGFQWRYLHFVCYWLSHIRN